MQLSYETVTNSLGPGKRYAIWVQGCDKRCKGCINPSGQNKNGGYKKDVPSLLQSIEQHTDVVGVTISGGEPFLQLKELYELVTALKCKSNLDVMLYSGYRYEELSERFGKIAEEVLNITDIFIDGEYVEELNNGSMLRGSDNQRIYFFTDKYKKCAEYILNSKKRDFSFEISSTGEVYFVGIPPMGMYEEFLKKLGGY